MSDFSQRILASREGLDAGLPAQPAKATREGGCGVVGFASTVRVPGRHIFEPSIQMHNRGNGKGGGIAAAGLIPEQMGIDAATLRDDSLLQIALLDPSVERELEEAYVSPHFRIDDRVRLEPAADHREIGLEARPPDIIRYFVRVKEDVLSRFAHENGLTDAPSRMVEDEFVYQNSFRLNRRFYAALGEKGAFVLSHARNLMIFKIVGYAEQVVRYYGLEDLRANVWIAHQRYPTRGRVWHPAGAHPFIGMNEALVHNGDFANYFGVSQYLRQYNITPLFLTDTEVSVLLFDLWHRTWGYPLEYVVEALAPTTELDFDRLPEEKKEIYSAIQAKHMHGSPDGPWFFIVARTDPDHDKLQLLGITDTSMLRPQVFALQEGGASIGIIASEKQAIDATLASLAREDSRFRPVADRYWNARGGSHTDGGAFVFTLEGNDGQTRLSCADKFGRRIGCPPGAWAVDPTARPRVPSEGARLVGEMERAARVESTRELFARLVGSTTPSIGGSGPEAACACGPASVDWPGELREIDSQGRHGGPIGCWSFEHLRWLIGEIRRIAARDHRGFEWSLTMLTMLNDRRYDCGRMRRSVVLQIVREGIDSLLDSVAAMGDDTPAHMRRIDWKTRASLRAPRRDETTLVVFADGFPPEGGDSDARLMVKAYELGWRRFVSYGLKGQRFTGCGFGPNTAGVRVDVFGSSGDYLASGIDGMEIHVHESGQDQLAQIMKSGTLVVHGDVGQAFMYGAKGGEVYVLGNAAGRPLINAAGRPRVVINGTCLDFLAESFMAGDPHAGGGFVILNGIQFDDCGRLRDQETPYPGSNLFSLASGGAIFVRDPHRKLVREQLNGGEFAELSDRDWELILPYLQANERHFGISIEQHLLRVGDAPGSPQEVYRKVRAVRLAALAR